MLLSFLQHKHELVERGGSYFWGVSGLGLGSVITLSNIESVLGILAALGGVILVWMRVYRDFKYGKRLRKKYDETE